MKFSILTALFAFLLTACGPYTWEQADKDKYVKKCIEKYSKDAAMKADGTDINKLCNCMVGKAEAGYQNPSAIDKAAEEKILEDCFIINSSNSKEGVWEQADRDKYVKKCIEKYSKDAAMKADGTDINELCNCMVGKAEAGYQNPSAIDKTAEEKILEDCFTIK